MITRTHAAILALFLCISFTCVTVWADGPNFSETYPLPITEMEDVISNWLSHAGFKIFRTDREFSQVRLSAEIREEVWEVGLSQQSPLAARVTIRKPSTGAINSILLNQLRNYISEYVNALDNELPDVQQEVPTIDPNRPNRLQNYISEYLNVPDIKVPDMQQGIPAAVLFQIESVVCIEARVAGATYQSSGFIINDNGLVVCTAHDLRNLEAINVILYDGSEIPGKILKMDFHRDLALVQINEKVDRFIPLSKPRNLLEKGERLYSVSCPMNLKKTVSLGIITAPRRANNLILWQVQMKIYPGNSGSPVFDEHGNLVAIVKGRYRGTDSVGFLIPFETLVEFVP